MGDIQPTAYYELLTAAELGAVALSTNIDRRCAHLDKVGIYATLGEGGQNGSRDPSAKHNVNQSWRRAGTLANAKRNALIIALENSRYNIKAAAAQLGIGRTTLYRLVGEYCVQLPTKVSTAASTENGLKASAVGNQSPVVRSRLEWDHGKLILTGLTSQN